MEYTAGIGLLGCGTVGAAVAERLTLHRDAIKRNGGVGYALRGIAVRNRAKRRTPALDARLFARDANALVDDPSVDVVVECIGGTGAAADLVERALDLGRHVVTANKALIATQGPRLQALAAARGVSLRYEAAAGGAVPVVSMVGDALAGDRIVALAGVLNGTSTAILSRMERGESFAQALEAAQRDGIAEADPSADLDGTDAAHKLAVLMQLAFGLAVISPRIRHAGIAAWDARDAARAAIAGLRLRLVAAAVRTPRGALAEVAPVLVAAGDDFGRTSGTDNAVRLVARDAGTLKVHGTGAGGAATASAVLSDVVGVLRAIGQRHDLRHRVAPDPAIDVEPLFARWPRTLEFPRYALWDDRAFTHAPASHDAARARPGKEPHS